MYKLGPGPLYSFYHPYHLCHLEVPFTVARMVLFGDVCGRPLGAPVVEVVAVAKRELRAGEVLDTFGGYLTYGQAEDAAVVQRDRLLPQGLAEGCVLRRDLPCDSVIGWDDVVAPDGHLAHRLYAEQIVRFAGEPARSA
jgi:predicted homoserine dehydrogenase-like protein